MYLIQVARELRRFVRIHTHYTRGIKNRLLYGKGAPAFAQLFFINPKDVKLVQKKSALYRKYALSGMVMGGDWDLQTYPVSELEKYHICRKHFVDGLSWEEAGAYANMARALRRNQTRMDVEPGMMSREGLTGWMNFMKPLRKKENC